jgi:tetratricopeptide (TPR) repeat protein
VQRACDLDPLCLVVNTSAAWVRYLAGAYDEAIDWCRHALDMEAHFGAAHRVLAAALVQSGRLDEAIVELEQAASERPDDWLTRMWLAHATAVNGDRDRARRIVSSSVPPRCASQYHLALAHVGIGDLDGATRSLTAACEARDPAIVNLRQEPRFGILRGDPRFVALVKQLGLQHDQDPSTAEE